MFDLLLGRGTAGLPPPAPIDFDSLRLPSSPNAALACPPGATAERHEAAPLLPVSLDAAWRALRNLGDGMERVWRMAEWPDRYQAQWVARSRIANFPDLINGEVRAMPGGTGLFLYSRSLLGYSDFGVNARRIADWRGAFTRALQNAR
ncbi:DUF1499 domain-containing protein [Roseomonas sp. AR75]|jgi:uncharacterized protein (DUF1499 family)|uniref:DUF1499 domain-containing protein n=1 Tax=Roseomonas sp. AR75 TaxID=2562311 RepID=UPI0010BFC016|nr:DUF1499 domain-containing protein [Roseomonas sp. AR75]